jgi:polyisoprenoid-binding protein YceI
MKKTTLAVALFLSTCFVFAQIKITTSAIIRFDATTSIDALPKAENKTAIAALDIKKGDVAFEVTIKNFSFTNPKMQEHFNSAGWMDSDKFPTATFKGKIKNAGEIKIRKNGTYNTQVEGDLTIHGITKPVKTSATLNISGKKISTKTDFKIKLEDYKISGGAIAAGKVAKEPTISVAADFK